MIQHCIGTSLINCVGISDTGNLLVWGSNKNTILGKRNVDLTASLPAKLALEGEDQLVVIDVSLGEFHAACLVNDKFTNKKFVRLNYAQDFFDEVGEKLLGMGLDIEAGFEKDIMEYARKFKGTKKIDLEAGPPIEPNMPVVSKECFCIYLQERVRLLFKDSFTISRVLGDIQYENPEFVNIREFRDQVLGYRLSNGQVYTWGDSTNGRLGRAEEKGKMYLTFCPVPKCVQFDKFEGKRNIIVKVSCGSSHTLALTNLGDVFAWGLGHKGCLGLGNVAEVTSPQRIMKTIDNAPFQSVRDISCGTSHSMAVTTFFTVYTWGCGLGGRLGHGSEEHFNMPKVIQKMPDGKVFEKISAGDSHSAAISSDMELYTWGDASFGKLGHGSFEAQLEPKHVDELSFIKIAEVSCGAFHTLCCTQNGKVYAFGGGADGKLGLDIIIDDDVPVPKLVAVLDDINIIDVAAGQYFSLALSEDGKVFSWGNNREGRLGVGSTKEVHATPEIIPKTTFMHPIQDKAEDQKAEDGGYKDYDKLMKKITKHPNSGHSLEVVQIAAGEDFTFFLTNAGKLYTCGNGEEGRLGLVPNNEEAKEEGEGEENEEEEKEGAGQEAGALAEEDKEEKEKKEGKEEKEAKEGDKKGKKASAEDKKVEDEKDKKSPEDKKDAAKKEEPEEEEEKERAEQLEPRQLDNEAIRFSYISCGKYHTIAISLEGFLYAWGRNKEGQLGLLGGDTIDKPKKVTTMEGIFCVMSACGDTHSLVLGKYGEVYSCGQDESGKLGRTQMVPGEALIELKCEFQFREVPGIRNAFYIACGAGHSLAMSNESQQTSTTVYTWGRGWHGQLGNKTHLNQYTPYKVEFPASKNPTFCMATCGENHTLLLDVEGEMWFAGHTFGIGVETAEQERKGEFVPVRNLSPKVPNEEIVYIATGSNHNLALATSGAVYAFGKNDYCKCGGKLSASYALFQKVKTNDITMCLVGCGRKHSILVDNRGFPYSWGNFTLGRLGIHPKNFDQKEKECLAIDRPKEIGKLKLLFIEEERKANSEPVVVAKVNARFVENVKYPIQKKLQSESSETKEELLSKRFMMTIDKLRSAINSFTKHSKEWKGKTLQQQLKVANAMISRIYTFPLKIPLMTDFLTKVPRNILLNRQTYESIFSLLQSHPCYILGLISEGIFKSKLIFIRFVKAVFDPINTNKNPRSIHLLTCLANNLIKMDIPKIDVTEIHKAIQQTHFYPVFRLIFKSQKCNLNCIQQYVQYVFNALINDTPTKPGEDLGESPEARTKKAIEIKKEQPMIEMLNKEKEEGKKEERPEDKKEGKIEDMKEDKKEEKKDEEQNEQSEFYAYNLENGATPKKEQRLIEIMTKLTAKIKKDLEASEQQTSRLEGRSFSPEIIWLLQQLKKKLTSKKSEIVKAKKEDQAASLIVYLLLEELWKQLTTKIKDVTFFVKRSVMEENMLMLGIKQNGHTLRYELQPKSNLSMIGECFIKFIKGEPYTFVGVARINTFIKGYAPFVHSIADQIEVKDYDQTLAMLQDSIKAASSNKPDMISVSLEDILFVHNLLFDASEIFKARAKIPEPKQAEDVKLGKDDHKPVKMPRWKELERSLLFKCFNYINFGLLGIKEYPEEEQNYSMNLTLPRQVLMDDSDIIKCPECDAIVNASLSSRAIVEKTYKQIGWTCDACNIQYDDGDIRCNRCKKCRDKDKVKKTSYLVKRFKPKHREAVLGILEELFVTLQLIPDDGDDLMTILDVQLKEYTASKKCREKHMIKKVQDVFKPNSSANNISGDEVLSELIRKLEDNYEEREDYLKYLHFVENIVKQIQIMEFRCYTMAAEEKTKTEDIIKRVMSGLGNDFLLEIQQAQVISGSLKKRDVVRSKDLAEFMKKTQAKADDDRKQGVTDMSLPVRVIEAYSPYGVFQIKQLKKEGVLINLKFGERAIMPVERKCYYHFFDNGDLGFRVLLIFHDTLITFYKCSSYTIECEVERFEITKEQFYEMRRNKCMKNNVFLGSGEFSQFHFINFLETIRSRIYCYYIP